MINVRKSKDPEDRKRWRVWVNFDISYTWTYRGAKRRARRKFREQGYGSVWVR